MFKVPIESYLMVSVKKKKINIADNNSYRYTGKVQLEQSAQVSKYLKLVTELITIY